MPGFNPDKLVAVATQKQALGVQFTPASAGHVVTYPTDAASRLNLTNLYQAAQANLIPNGVNLTVAGPTGAPARVLFTEAEVIGLGEKALAYFLAIEAHSDALLAGSAQWSDPWPSNA